MDVLALSEDQAIFFPKSFSLTLLDKLKDILGKSAMLEPFFDTVTKVALRSNNIGKFTLMTQSIGHQVGTS